MCDTAGIMCNNKVKENKCGGCMDNSHKKVDPWLALSNKVDDALLDDV